jgi:DNA sulfur modification protein DndB
VQKPDLGNETISVVIFVDEGLRKSQQIFADLNQHAIRPTKSIGILYDSRDSFSRMTLEIIDAVPIFSTLTELEKTNISNRSTKLFTLSSIYKASKELLGKRMKHPKVTQEEKELVIDFWNEVLRNMVQWQQLLDGKTTSHDLRQNYVNAHGVILDALAMAGRALIQAKPADWRSGLRKLKTVNWSRDNAKVWEGRALIGGRLSKTQSSTILTANYLKTVFGLSLSPEDARLEQRFLKANLGD